MTDRYFDDFKLGERFVTRGVTLTESMILDFALHYDPQPFHIDVEAAKQSSFGGLIASGFQTLTLSFRMVLETGVLRGASMGSPGCDELRWPRPVRPGDTLHVEFEITDTRLSRSKPDRGLVGVKYRTLNQRDEEVLTLRSTQLIGRKPG